MGHADHRGPGSADALTFLDFSEEPDFPDGLECKGSATLEPCPAGELCKRLTSGPDADGDGFIDSVVEVNREIGTEQEPYDFTIAWNGSGQPPVLVLDSVPAEWQVTQITPAPGGIVNVCTTDGPACQVLSAHLDRGMCSAPEGRVGDPCTRDRDCGRRDGMCGPGDGISDSSSTNIEWSAGGSGVMIVDAENRDGGKFLAPTSCGPLLLNEHGAVAVEVDENGDVVRDQDGNPIVVFPEGATALPLENGVGQICLAAVEDLTCVNGEPIDTDGDGYTEAYCLAPGSVPLPCNDADNLATECLPSGKGKKAVAGYPELCGCGGGPQLDGMGDEDNDGIPDFQEACVDGTNPCDTDNDGVQNEEDVCEGFDDNADVNGDGTPDCLQL